MRAEYEFDVNTAINFKTTHDFTRSRSVTEWTVTPALEPEGRGSKPGMFNVQIYDSKISKVSLLSLNVCSDIDSDNMSDINRANYEVVPNYIHSHALTRR